MGALQFALFALVVPAFAVFAAPFANDHLSGRVAHFAAQRKRHAGFSRALAVLVCSEAVLALWRTPMAVNGLVHHIWLAPVELVTLAIAGAALWLVLVDSPPFAPRSPRQRRIVLAALAMWTTWTLAYLVGLSHNTWYTAYASVPGRVVSVAADQQIMAGLLWAVAAFTFLPVIFANLMAWLRDEQDPDEELASLTREERRRQRWNPTELKSGESS
jgi:cytochrome c oxidase assembly factor CtaG